ncbi:MAG: hypothetical protein ACOC4M_08015 [Promethearchaeia archaeon]
MKYFDFDRPLQEIFNAQFSELKTVDWKNWLHITSKEEFVDLALKNSGLNEIDNIFNLVKTQTTSSRDFAINPSQFLSHYSANDIPILTHSSGTTNPAIENLKWFHMSSKLIQRLWAPGMRAIFESGNLTEDSSAIIFVPSRLEIDGIQERNNQEYISLYSLEFSQRVALAVINPRSYVFFPYKESYSLRTIAYILELKNISTISTSFLTILGWANHKKMKEKFRLSLKNINRYTVKNETLERLLNLIEEEGLDKATSEIQKKLSEKIKGSFLISGISSLTRHKKVIHDFMQWKENRDRYINLYVASEIGPFAASIQAAHNLKMEKFVKRDSNIMQVFPLTLPVIQEGDHFKLLIETSRQVGKLYTSRMHDSKPLINIDIGDVIFIESYEPPQIGGTILRAGFELEYPIKLTEKVEIPTNSNIYVGDYFDLAELEIINPKNLLDCIVSKIQINIDSLLMVRTGREDKPWNFVLPSYELSSESEINDRLIEIIKDCPHGDKLADAINTEIMAITFTDEDPVDYLRTREEILKKVRSGKFPKGILKKWPLYLAVSPDHKKKIC